MFPVRVCARARIIRNRFSVINLAVNSQQRRLPWWQMFLNCLSFVVVVVVLSKVFFILFLSSLFLKTKMNSICETHRVLLPWCHYFRNTPLFIPQNIPVWKSTPLTRQEYVACSAYRCVCLHMFSRLRLCFRIQRMLNRPCCSLASAQAKVSTLRQKGESLYLQTRNVWFLELYD